MVATAQTAPRRAREYETIYILRPNINPDDAEKVSQRVGEVIDRLGAKLTKVDNWGKRKLAYPIQRHSRGIFIYVRYVGFGEVVHELERNLRLLDNVIRHQTVRLREDLDIDAVEVDPEEVKFLRIEPTEDEEEPGIEQRLGFAPAESRKERPEEGTSEGETDATAESAESSDEEE